MLVLQARTIEQRLGIRHALLRPGRRGLGRGLALLQRQCFLRRQRLGQTRDCGGIDARAASAQERIAERRRAQQALRFADEFGREQALLGAQRELAKP